ncbi:tyrosine-type recombinase/integrase [Nocardia sp. CA-107356]|uniref:tyrosine-type recombinase/integrase n=1 Tax=Nocardia sp. CA-107356 TaxID=3239972 RepID=UPI003D8AFCA8
MGRNSQPAPTQPPRPTQERRTDPTLLTRRPTHGNRGTNPRAQRSLPARRQPDRPLVGPRRSEIQRLELDCLDTYPDGHPRLRIPAGKTYTERIVPLHPEAADALRECINATRSRKQRPLIDEVTGKPTHYVFQIRGRLMTDHRLFDSALRTACDNTGLVDHTGAKLVTSHRFRHTVGTQRAEQGARLQTIMSILGHSSSTMCLIYARITDTTVFQDYKDALQPGAQIAGPAAAALRNNKLSQTTIDWLHSNYYKTALELGHCLRLPEEGPCECDLYLTCSKFLTTTEYAPRLKDRHCLEHTLAEDATGRRWPREAERHNAIATRLETLLTELESGADSSQLEHLPARDNDCDE